MKVVVAVTRIYGTADRYGEEPRLRPDGAPILFTGYPDDLSSARIDFGPVPDDVAKAELGRRILGRVMLGVLGAEYDGMTPDEKFAAAAEEFGPDPPYAEFNWYSTLVVSRELDVPETDMNLSSFAFVDDAFAVADEARAHAKDALDVLTTIASTVVDPRAFDELVLDDRVHLFAPGKHPAGVPIMTVSAAGAATRGTESVERLERRLRAFSSVDTRGALREVWLTRTSHWHVQALLEADPWKRFLWSFVGLEVLTNKLHDHFRDDVIARLRLEQEGGVIDSPLPLDALAWSSDRAPLAARFAIVAVALFPESASDDTARFREIKIARDRLSHGSLREESDLPVSAAMGLLAKYLDGAIKSLMFQVPADTEWEVVESVQQPGD